MSKSHNLEVKSVGEEGPCGSHAEGKAKVRVGC